jgi:hypothetical protein
MQAKSIVEGKPLEFIEANRLTIEQSSYPIGPIAYPWGYPTLLAPIYAVFGFDIFALKSVSVVCFILFILVLWFTFRKYHSGYWRILFLCLFAFNPYLIQHTDGVYSDLPFLLFSTISVMLMGTVIVERKRIFSRVLDHIILGFVIAATYFVRTNGILLLITLGITQFTILISNVGFQKCKYDNQTTHKNFSFLQIKHNTLGNLCINLLPYASFIILLLSWNSLFPNGGSYHVSQLSNVSFRSICNMINYNINESAEFFGIFPNKYLIYGATIPLALTGIIWRWRSDLHIIIYITLTILLFSIWPYRQGLRFLFPILPFYYSFMMTSLEKFHRSGSGIEQSIYKIICTLPIIVIVSYFSYAVVKNAYANVSRNRSISNGPYVETSKEMFTYISNNISPASTVIFWKPRVMRMMTGRKSLMVDKLEELTRGDYLCIYMKGDVYDQISIKDLENLIAKQYIELVFKNKDFKIYRLSKSYKNA